jgi:hypothetical protein
MPASERTELVRRARALWGSSLVDCAARVQLWTREGDSPPHPTTSLGRVYGGRYDTIDRRFVDEPLGAVSLISAHRGQVALVEAALEGTHRHVMALGAPGGGKTYGAVVAAYLLAMRSPNLAGGIVAPTGNGVTRVWDAFVRLAKSFGTFVDANIKDHWVLLVNGCLVQFVGAKAADEQTGTPIQGWTWEWCVVDESQSISQNAMNEVEYRGRTAGDRYRIIETATNSFHPEFRARVEAYKAAPEDHLILRYAGEENVWVPLSHWKKIRGSNISEREYRAKVLCEDVPPEHVLYPSFGYAQNILQLPPWQDITERVVSDLAGFSGRRYVIGQDFGVLRTVSIVLRCLRNPKNGRRTWWAVHELTSFEGTHTGEHAAQLARIYEPGICLVVGDPHSRSQGDHADRADYTEFTLAGFSIVPAVARGQISIRSRLSMVNGLLKNAAGESRLFIAADDHGKPCCPLLAQSLLAQEVPESGRFSDTRKDYRDLSHWPDAIGYGLWLFEQPDMALAAA